MRMSNVERPMSNVEVGDDRDTSIGVSCFRSAFDIRHSEFDIRYSNVPAPTGPRFAGTVPEDA